MILIIFLLISFAYPQTLWAPPPSGGSGKGNTPPALDTISPSGESELSKESASKDLLGKGGKHLQAPKTQDSSNSGSDPAGSDPTHPITFQGDAHIDTTQSAFSAGGGSAASSGGGGASQPGGGAGGTGGKTEIINRTPLPKGTAGKFQQVKPSLRRPIWRRR
ncbi:MAG: hypothetical protein HY584_03640 [Candidatus Omnitrophica bacterium]|nr:hypothetical protein [Candidatus Omnitrophota bacterium]